MARTHRDRFHGVPFSSGYLDKRVNGVPTYTPSSNYYEFSTDSGDYIHQPVVDSEFRVEHMDKSKLDLLNGYNDLGGGNYVSVVNFPLGQYGSAYDGNKLAAGEPNSSTLATTALARTNPSRPEYVPGNLIQDIADIPRDIRFIGEALRGRHNSSKGVANAYLSAKFGWLPLYEDMSKMLDVHRYIDRRNEELKRLYSKEGLRRRVSLGRYTATDVSTQNVSSGTNGTLTCRRNRFANSECWATLRWKPNALPSQYPSDTARLALAKRIVLGATASGAFASSWDLIPWTWLLGWSVNVRDFVLAHGNTISCAHGKVNVMVHHEQTQQFTVTSRSGWLHGGDGSISHERKYRYIESKAALNANIPHLSGERLSILGALAVQRFR
ncbi:MAG: putative maturation protein [Alehxovirus pseudonemorisvicinum]|uniref:Maturation protein n=1 Tax=Leviviridae sp. TaxID=2027243 RepID=A0ABY3SSA1_9VIRU|nr:MAG: putative maturation protein [Leviviridae sp.]